MGTDGQAAPPVTSELPGLDLAALTRYLDAAAPGLRQGPLSARLLAGGRSNLTYRVADGTSEWALRRPPLAHALPTAHDMAREYRILRALHGTDVPVARPVLLCEDAEVLGAPFYVMDFVDGVVLYDPRSVPGITAAKAGAACGQLVDILLALHAVDPAAVGLADFGKPAGFLARQLRRWAAQWDASPSEGRPDMSPLLALLERRLPEQSASGIVHGDYRLSNVIFDREVTRIQAVLDWEMAALGDPLADVGLLFVYHGLSMRGAFGLPAISAGEGFLTPEALLDLYANGSDRDLGDLDWYIAFAEFKLAVISQGIHYRYLLGKTVGEGFELFGDSVPEFVSSAEQRLSRGQS